MPRRRRILDKEATYENYRRRMEELQDTFDVFEGAYMSTFELYSTVSDIDEGSQMDCFAGVLLRLVREHGVQCLGVTSERKKNGQYMCTTLLNGESREEANLVYIGKYSYFSGNQRSIYSPLAIDNAYLPEADPSQDE